ncbi:kinase-like protein [Rhizoctonia solani]|nr:kinase-like protein [Rhizoctonia solani]
MQNGSLTQHLKRNNSRGRLQFCIDLAGTVQYLHRNGIVHGDIKTDNVILSNSGDVQLVDFGSATLINYLTLHFTRTSSQLAWTVRFAAPEILLETRETHTPESDVYSLGMTILQILAGELPYARMSDVAVLVNVIKESLPPRPTVGTIHRDRCTEDKLWELLLRCWNYNPELRPTAMEVKEALINIERESGI